LLSLSSVFRLLRLLAGAGGPIVASGLFGWVIFGLSLGLMHIQNPDFDGRTLVKKCCGVKSFVLALILAPASLLAQPFTFAEQGPGPIANGQDEGITTAGVPNPVAGAVNAFAFQPGSSDIMYAATVNGGIWKTTNATSVSPTWTPLTDQAFPSSLSINSIAISPVDNNTIYAGTGSTSSDGFDGNPGFGVAKSTDGGVTWTLLGGATFAGMQLADIIPASLGSPSGSVVMTANFYEGGGVYRSTNGGSSFTRISGAAGSGLPSAGVSSLVADPGNADRFYAAVPHISSATAHGIYKSTDGGQTWALVAPLPGTADNNSFRTLLAVHNSANGNVLWAMVIDSTTGSASGIFSSNNQGGAWVSLGVPSPILFPGGQGTLHGAISADPSNPNRLRTALSIARIALPVPTAHGGD
jgi:hypothetical protein